MVHVLGPRDKAKSKELTKSGVRVIDTTSRSSEPWTAGLSPFNLGPVELYSNFHAENVENAGQYSKVYKQHIDKNGDPTKNYWQWAIEGWHRKRADRYPMGKGSIPEYSYWKKKKLGYIEARKKIYWPLYANSVRKTVAFKKLQKIYELNGEVALWDFDGYDYISLGIPLKEVIDIPERKMGHAFVLAMLLEYYKTNNMRP